jgi:hypothetical protein
LSITTNGGISIPTVKPFKTGMFADAFKELFRQPDDRLGSSSRASPAAP